MAFNVVEGRVVAPERSLSPKSARKVPRKWARSLFGLDPREVSFSVRGFVCDLPAVRERLETVGGSVVAGFHAALEEADPAALAERLQRFEQELQGFAHEGAGMALALLDGVAPRLGARPRRFDQFVTTFGAAHVYLMIVGAGWTLAWLPRSPRTLLSRLDPLLGALALDGYGFHQGFFHPKRTIDEGRLPRKVRGDFRRGFDQGVGRSLWFVFGAEPTRIAASIARFERVRQGDLWCGVGLACAYAGGRDRQTVETVRTLAGCYAPDLAVGVSRAALARMSAQNVAPQTEIATAVFCQLDAAETAAAIARDGLDLPRDSDVPAYEIWRQRVRARFAPEGDLP